MRRHLLAGAALLWLTSSAFAGQGKCTISKFSELPITLMGLRAETTININGVDLPMALDSGAFYSTLSASAAAELKLKSAPFIGGLQMEGIGRSHVETSIAEVKSYDLSLQLRPKRASSLYGRGIDKLREHRTAEGEADIAQATALAPEIVEEFGHRGITP